MSINTKPNTKPNAKASSRKLNVVNVVEQTQVNTADALVEQLMETTTAHIQNFTLNSIVPLVAVPVKRVRATRAKVADVDYDATESDVADAVFNKRKSKKSPAPAEVTDVAADSDVVAVVNKRKSKKSPAPAEVTDVAADSDAVAVVSKRKPKKSPAPAEVTDVAADSDVVAVVNKRKSKKSPAPAERKPKSNAMPVVEPFTPSPSPFMPNTPSLSTTHNDVEVEEVSVDGVIYYKDADGNLYDHATFEPITK
jgi:hypothetical protein